MRLFKRPSTSPQLVSATPIPQDEAASSRTFAESNAEAINDASIKVEEAYCTPKTSREAESATDNPMSGQSSSFSARKGISTWGRKVGRRWDQLKRSDSSELLSVSGRRRRWSPNRKTICDTNEEKDKCRNEGSSGASMTKPKRISRVESLRNLFRASDRGSSNNINGDSSTRSVTIEEEEDDVTMLSHYTMDKAVSEGALRNVAQFRLSAGECRNESLHEKKKQLSQSIQSFQEQQRVFDYILKNQEILKTQEGMSFARDTLDKVQNVLQNNVNITEEERNPGNVEHNKNDVTTQIHEANKSNVKRNLFSVRTNSADSERSEQRRSFIGSGLEDLLCTLRLGCDESGYDSDSTRAGADSPDSEKAIPSMLKRRSFSITSDDYQGIDLSLPVSTPKKNNTTTVETTITEQCNESINGDCADSTFDESVRTETTLMSDDDDDTDSCDEDTFADYPDYQFTACFPPRNSETTNCQPKKCISTSTVISENLIAKSEIQRTPIKRTSIKNEDTISLQRVRLQNLQKDRKTGVAIKGRKASNASVLNLLENAASPSKDSPPATKIRSPLPFNYVQYYSPKRSRSNLESEEKDRMHPIKRPVFVTPIAPPPPPPPPSASVSASKTLIRRELKTTKIFVEKAGNLGISVEKREAVRPFYVVSKLDGEAAKSKQIRVGDEVVRVSGRRLRGMSINEARNALKNCVGNVELQIAREPTFNFDGELGDTWGEPMTRTKSDTAVWTLRENSTNQNAINVDNSCQNVDNEETKNCRIVGALTKDGKSVSMHAMNIAEHENDGKTKITGMRKFQVMRKRNSMPAAKTKRATSLSMDLLTVNLEKGATKKLGFSIVGGSDSVKGSMGIFVKDIMDGGQAADEGTLRAGDEILAINGQTLDGVTHAKALQYFKAAKPGKLILHVGRRDPTHRRSLNKL